MHSHLVYERSQHIPEGGLASTPPIEGYDHLHHQRVARHYVTQTQHLAPAPQTNRQLTLKILYWNIVT